MSIIASASVPSEHRLDGANTTDLALIRADLGLRIQELDSTYVQPLSDAEVARRLGVGEHEVHAARFPVNQAYTGRAAVPTQPTAEMLALGQRAWELAQTSPKPLSDRQLAVNLGTSEARINAAVLAYLNTQPPAAAALTLGRSVDAMLNADPHATYDEVAADLGITVDQALDARNNIVCLDEGVVRLIRIPEPVEGRTDFLGRPSVDCGVAWCAGNCTFDDGFAADEHSHNRTLVDDRVADGSAIGERRRLFVQLQSFHSPSAGDCEEPSIYLSTGDDDGYAAKLTLDEAEVMALALLAGIRAARAAR
ncbi:hypothetical protein [Micromonospora ureilytica]|uniref:Uncharacterized protein n=1 Tax=Micromonospora ureilytica TaxID=709868 RepID=A0ABS0JSN0_9ACTN|nr:hypothetical protein [Micromonospora ureilytica]MBG6070052.1 hypothetical protein [Micromonospora ureilytica]